MRAWSSFGVRLGVVLGVAGFFACADEGFGNVSADEAPATYADVFCGQADACGCFDGVAGAEDACKAQLEPQMQQLIDMGKAAGLTYDGNCVGTWLDLLSSLGCRTEWGEADLGGFADDCVGLCKVFHGDRGVGEPCGDAATVGWGDECAQGLMCVGERCADPCARVGEGGDCTATNCEIGLYCEYEWDVETEEMSGTCVRAAQQGEDCTEKRCGDDLECDFETMTCAPAPPLPAVGEACMGSCQETAYCDTTDIDPANWVCVAKKGDGEACENDQECVSWSCEDGTCMAEGPLVCSFGF